VPQVGTPIGFSSTPPAYEHGPPLLGEHTAVVLRERLHIGDAALSELVARGIVGVRNEARSVTL
jgi:crotonobetainyl-CoA:carnitine CoA-transferase CaiB-like acyl-CoA transferase